MLGASACGRVMEVKLSDLVRVTAQWTTSDLGSLGRLRVKHSLHVVASVVDTVLQREEKDR